MPYLGTSFKWLQISGKRRVLWVDLNEIERAAAEEGALFIADECRNSEEAFKWARRGGDVGVFPAGLRYIGREFAARIDDAASCAYDGPEVPGAIFQPGWAINMACTREKLQARFPGAYFKFYRLADVSEVLGRQPALSR
jgi:hypothetical protein